MKKIKFVDFWKEFDLQETFMNEALEQIGDWELSDEPDYVFYGPFGGKHLDYDNSIKIFCTGECVSPDFNLCDYAIGFDHLTFGDRYIRIPDYYNTVRKKAFERCCSKHEHVEEALAQKKAFCSFVYSHADAHPFRTEFFHALSAYKKVDSGGRYMNNIGQPKGVVDKLAFEGEHKFSIAFENSSHPGYSTEKLLESFGAWTVPIYWGDPLIAKSFNPKAFINVSDFDSPEDAIAYIKEIDNDPVRYEAMLREPAILSDKSREAVIADLVAFLNHIFEQPKETAYRRERANWGRRYTGTQIAWRNSYEREERLYRSKLRSIRKSIKGIFKK